MDENRESADIDLTAEDVVRLATLARLDLPADQVETRRAELARLLSHFAVIAELGAEIDDLPPLLGDDSAGDDSRKAGHPTPARTSRSDDTADGVLTQEAALANAPRRRAGQFVVPRVVGGAKPSDRS